MNRQQVTPRFIKESGLHNPFTGNKSWTVECGGCPHAYKDKLPLAQTASSLCPACGAQNIWDVRKFFEIYSMEI